MENFIMLLITITIIGVASFVVCVVISAINYVREEVNHAIKNMKRSARNFMWDVEWRWNHR